MEEGFNPVETGGEHLVDALEFLDKSKKANCRIDLGETIAIIGGGDVAMDCARAAKRSLNAKNVHIVYRRTREFMPAEPEEIRLALADGVELKELLSPVEYDGNSLKLNVMKLGEKGEDGEERLCRPMKQKP